MQVQDDVQKKSKKKKTKATNVIARYGRYSKVFENYYALFCFFEKKVAVVWLTGTMIYLDKYRINCSMLESGTNKE